MRTRFKEARQMLHLTQFEFAEVLDKSERAVQTWEQGQREPSYAILCRIADMCGVTTDWLLGRTDIKTFTTDNEPISTDDLTSDLREGEKALIGSAGGDEPIQFSQAFLDMIDAAVQKALEEREKKNRQ